MKNLKFLLLLFFVLFSACQYHGSVVVGDFVSPTNEKKGTVFAQPFKNGSLQIVNRAGDIKIKTWNKNSIQVLPTYWYEDEANLQRVKMQIDFDNESQQNKLAIHYIYEPEVINFSIDLEVFVPANTIIKQIFTGAGNVKLQGSYPSAVLETRAGRISVEHLQSGYLTTRAGDITVESVGQAGTTKNFQAQTRAGDIEIGQAENLNIDLQTRAGNIEVGLIDIVTARLVTRAGDIDIEADQKSISKIRYQTRAGTVTVNGEELED